MGELVLLSIKKINLLFLQNISQPVRSISWDLFHSASKVMRQNDEQRLSALHIVDTQEMFLELKTEGHQGLGVKTTSGEVLLSGLIQSHPFSLTDFVYSSVDGEGSISLISEVSSLTCLLPGCPGRLCVNLTLTLDHCVI